jgi:hypothetical protein
VLSHPGHRSTSIPEDKASFLPIVVANIIPKSEAGIFGSAAVSLLKIIGWSQNRYNSNVGKRVDENDDIIRKIILFLL